MITEKRKLLQLVAAVLLAVMLLTACASGASKAADKIELGQKYLTELNYTEAVASFTEAIRLDPDNIQAYMGPKNGRNAVHTGDFLYGTGRGVRKDR